MAEVDIREGEELGHEDQGDETAGQPGQASAPMGEAGLLRNTWADAPPPMPEPAPTAQPSEDGEAPPPPVMAGKARRRSLNPLIRLGHMLSGGPNQEG